MFSVFFILIPYIVFFKIMNITVVGKVVVLGDRAVGKTSTLLRYIEQTFSSSVSPTIGACLFTCKVPTDNYTVQLQIWDSPGLKALAPMFCRNANGALLIFDITSIGSFINMQLWLSDLKTHIDSAMVLCVVGNKSDLAKSREVTSDEAIQYAKSIGATYHECSARKGKGINIVFESVAHGFIQMFDHNRNHNLNILDGENISQNSESTNVANERSKCCYFF